MILGDILWPMSALEGKHNEQDKRNAKDIYSKVMNIINSEGDLFIMIMLLLTLFGSSIFSEFILLENSL